MSIRRHTPDSLLFFRGHFQWHPNETFGDPRTFGQQGSPLRHVILEKVTLDGGSFSLNPITGQLVVVARETLKIVSSTGPRPGKHDTGQGQFYSSHHKPTSNVGPGGASLDATQNFWKREIRTTHIPTTVAWGPEQFREKAFVGCANGDILVWDFGTGAAHLDAKVKESPRAIHAIASAPISPYSFASGSADGCIRLWDWRERKGPVYIVAHRHASVRSLAIGPFADAQLNIVAGLDSGMLFRYDLRYRIEYLDRLVAHDANIQSITWLPPDGDRAMNGHIVTGSLDNTVKVWHVTSGRIAANPVHTLHTPYPVGRIATRPEHDTEVVVLPFHGGAAATTASVYEVDDSTPEFDRFAPQIWDVRKGWIAKWGMSGILGPATDMVVKDSHLVQILYKSGTIAQHDLHQLSKPPDSVNKQCLAWTPHSKLVFATGPQRSFDPPYDDLYPHVVGLLKDYDLVDKRPGDRLTLSANQAIASQDIPDDFDRVAFTKLARGYLLDDRDGDKIKICKVNQEVAASAGQHQIAETWSVVASLLAPFAPLVPEPSSTAHDTAVSATPITNRTTLSPGASPKPILRALSSGLSDGITLARKSSGGSAMLHQSLDLAKRRCSSPSLLSASRPSTSSRSSPASRAIALPAFSSSSSSSVSPHPNTPTASTPKRLEIERRTSSSTLSNPNESPVSAGIEARVSSGNWSAGGDGALEDSDSDEEDEALGMADPNEFERAFAGKTPTARGTKSSWSKERRAMSLSAGGILLGGGIGTLTLGPKGTSATGGTGTGGSAVESSPESLRAKKPLPATRAFDRSSPRASPRMLSPRVLPSDLPDVDEESSSVDRGRSEQSSGSETDSRPSFDSNGPAQKTRTNGNRRRESQESSVESERGHRESVPPSPILARAPGPLPSASKRIGVPPKDTRLQKRESMSSVRTAVPAGSGPGGTIRARKGIKVLDSLRGRSDLVDEGREDHSSSLRAPHLRDVFDSATGSNPNNSLSKRSTRSRSSGGGLVGDKAISIVIDERPRDGRGEWMVPERQEEIARMEGMIREGLWANVKESLEYYADIGDVQTCALLAMVVPEELGISEARIEQFVESYIDLLSRFELHVVAAYVRKHAPVQWIRGGTAINCSMSTQCVRCRKTINNRSSSSSESMQPPGALAYCQNCLAPAILCSICHLPVRKLLMFCNGCGHGGHQICYRRFYSKHPMIEVAVERTDKPPQRKRPPAISPSRDAGRGRRRDMRASASGASGTGDGEEQGQRREIEQDISVPEEYLIVQQLEKEERERIKTRVQGHLCVEGCGHICWVANEFFTLT